jgi:hypothetical protein
VRFFGLSLILSLVIVVVLTRPAEPQSELVMPSEQYTSEKARRLSMNHHHALRDLGHTVYHCLPWLEVQRGSIGFFKPKHAATDDRYLSLRAFVEQESSASFTRLSSEQRAAAMFSRYVGHLMRRMAASRALVTDPELAGFTVIVEWVKPQASVNGRRVHETIAVFVDKPVAVGYLGGRIGMAELAQRSRVLAFDGETALGEIRLGAWDDDFASTYRPENYRLPAGMDCRRRG